MSASPMQLAAAKMHMDRLFEASSLFADTLGSYRQGLAEPWWPDPDESDVLDAVLAAKADADNLSVQAFLAQARIEAMLAALGED